MTNQELKTKALIVIYSCIHTNQLEAARRYCYLVSAKLYPVWQAMENQRCFYDEMIEVRYKKILEDMSYGE